MNSAFLSVYLLFLITSTASSVKSDTELQSSTDLCKTYHKIQTTALTSSSSSCNIRCFRADPVCGENGVTYWCGCPEAVCEGVRVVKRGYCEVGNGGNSGQVLLIVHIVWMIVVGVAVVFGLF